MCARFVPSDGLMHCILVGGGTAYVRYLRNIGTAASPVSPPSPQPPCTHFWLRLSFCFVWGVLVLEAFNLTEKYGFDTWSSWLTSAFAHDFDGDGSAMPCAVHARC